MSTLVLVESPNKIAKLSSYLGAGYEVLATVGHVRDLPKSELGVDEATFTPNYEVLEKKRAVVSRIRAAAQKASTVLLATDPDREGEAIAWHVAELLKLRHPQRITYQEITHRAVQAALAAVRPLDQHRVDAQQARRVLDRLVGYKVSPLLAPFGRNHSAGRVQSAVLHELVRRELAREAFKPETYWTLSAEYTEGFRSRHATYDAAKDRLVDVRFPSEAEALEVAARARGPHLVESVDTVEKPRRPSPPLNTATMLKLAGQKLRMSLADTTRIAQELFEAGAITYHRTDSVALSDEAVAMARDFIASDYPEALPDTAPRYKAGAEAQEAHEAIRPTSLDPALTAAMTREQRLLFELIRRAFLASQCKPALVARTIVTIRSGETTWRATGSTVTFPSFLKYLDDTSPDAKQAVEAEEQRLPPLAPGQVLGLVDVKPERKVTEPPVRYSEGSIIDWMRKTGVGRPSTYAAILRVLALREYVVEEKKRLLPTQRGRLVDAVLGESFPDLLEPNYTASMEARLDEIAAGERAWAAELRAWYDPFAAQLAAAPAKLAAYAAAHPELAASLPAAPRATDRACPRCSAPLFLRAGKKGEFLACSGYPTCSYTADPSAVASTRTCPACQGPMEEMAGRFGAYARCLKAGCTGRLDLAPSTTEPCPLCGGAMRDRGSFLSCATYPACKGALDKTALAKAQKANRRCPKCRAHLLEKTGAKGRFLGCAAYPKCRHAEPLEPSRPRSPPGRNP